MTADSTTADAIETLLRRIPECWEVAEINRLTSAHRQALALLTTTGLVERRIGIRPKSAGLETSVTARISLTGERGLVKASIQAPVAMVWSAVLNGTASPKPRPVSPWRTILWRCAEPSAAP